VDAAIQPYLLQHATGSYYYWECIPFNFPRMGPAIKYVLTVSPMLHRCKDGYVFLSIGGGATAGMADSTARFVQWMHEEGAAPQWLVKRDWAFEHDTSKMTQEEVDRVINPFVEFLRTKTKSEVSEEAAKRGIMACAVSDTADICHDRHLQARDFWVEIEHPELGQSITYNGPFIKLSEAPMKTFRRAPLIGEHNEEIYEKELGLSREELIRLCEAGVI
jgi:crotonobetainyl-CoA:carnitine CoA-transferase CaiB-like acyl-CoA transferase